MTLYEIDEKIRKCWVDGEDVIDTETGEYLDEQYLADLKMEKADKIRNIACWIKNLESDAEQLKLEKQKLAARQKTAENKAESLKKFLAYFVGEGRKIDEPTYKISWRKSEVVEIEEGTKLSDEYLTFKAPEPNKTAIKSALKAGSEIEGCKLVTKNNMQVK